MVRAISRWVVALFPLWGAVGLGCERGQDRGEVEFQIDGNLFRFTPRVAWAEYFELPGQPDQVKITLASYALKCGEFVNPAEGEMLVTFTLRAPAHESIQVEQYVWKGLTQEEFQDVETREVIPFIRLAQEGQTLLPGGSFQLEHLDKAPHGRLVGHFSFAPEEGKTDGFHPTTLRGTVKAQVCHASQDPNRGQLGQPSN